MTTRMQYRNFLLSSCQLGNARREVDLFVADELLQNDWLQVNGQPTSFGNLIFLLHPARWDGAATDGNMCHEKT